MDSEKRIKIEPFDCECTSSTMAVVKDSLSASPPQKIRPRPLQSDLANPGTVVPGAPPLTLVEFSTGAEGGRQ